MNLPSSCDFKMDLVPNPDVYTIKNAATAADYNTQVFRMFECDHDLESGKVISKQLLLFIFKW